jgi:IclR family acetate operon transcriptional repressor
MAAKLSETGFPRQKREPFRETRVPSVDRAFDLLELLTLSDQGLTLSEVSQKLQIPRSSAHYLIQSLAYRGYLERNPAGRAYILGLRVANFANSAPARSQLRLASNPYLQGIVKKLGLTAQLGVLDGGEALVIDRVAAPTDVRFDSWVGRHFELHCTALGKALIAHLPDSELKKLFEGRGMPRHNPNTICSLEAVRAQLAEVRANGYASDNEEHELGVRCVAAPIFNYLGNTVAAICVFSSITRFPAWQVPAVGKLVISAASEVSRQLRDPLMLQPPASPSSSATSPSRF